MKDSKSWVGNSEVPQAPQSVMNIVGPIHRSRMIRLDQLVKEHEVLFSSEAIYLVGHVIEEATTLAVIAAIYQQKELLNNPEVQLWFRKVIDVTSKITPSP